MYSLFTNDNLKSDDWCMYILYISIINTYNEQNATYIQDIKPKKIKIWTSCNVGGTVFVEIYINIPI